LVAGPVVVRRLRHQPRRTPEPPQPPRGEP
jgi:hypothetical protein